MPAPTPNSTPFNPACPSCGDGNTLVALLVRACQPGETACWLDPVYGWVGQDEVAGFDILPSCTGIALGTSCQKDDATACENEQQFLDENILARQVAGIPVYEAHLVCIDNSLPTCIAGACSCPVGFFYRPELEACQTLIPPFVPIVGGGGGGCPGKCPAGMHLTSDCNCRCDNGCLTAMPPPAPMGG
jgi:hypothetical protein